MLSNVCYRPRSNDTLKSVGVKIIERESKAAHQLEAVRPRGNSSRSLRSQNSDKIQSLPNSCLNTLIIVRLLGTGGGLDEKNGSLSSR